MNTEYSAKDSLQPKIRLSRALRQKDHERMITELESIFQSGSLPDPSPEGPFAGEFLAFQVAPGLSRLAARLSYSWTAWRGKLFDSKRSRGSNIITQNFRPVARLIWPFYHGYLKYTDDTYLAFPFKTSFAAGITNPDLQVLQINYDVQENPRWIVRRVLDELIQIEPDYYLGKAYFHWWWGHWQVWSYFCLYR